LRTQVEFLPSFSDLPGPDKECCGGPKANASWSNLSVVATYEHTSSASFSTRLQLTGMDVEPDEPGRYAPSNHRLMAPEDTGTGHLSTSGTLRGAA
jgi:hypothetical protein